MAWHAAPGQLQRRISNTSGVTEHLTFLCCSNATEVDMACVEACIEADGWEPVRSVCCRCCCGCCCCCSCCWGALLLLLLLLLLGGAPAAAAAAAAAASAAAPVATWSCKVPQPPPSLFSQVCADNNRPGGTEEEYNEWSLFPNRCAFFNVSRLLGVLLLCCCV